MLLKLGFVCSYLLVYNYHVTNDFSSWVDHFKFHFALLPTSHIWVTKTPTSTYNLLKELESLMLLYWSDHLLVWKIWEGFLNLFNDMVWVIFWDPMRWTSHLIDTNFDLVSLLWFCVCLLYTQLAIGCKHGKVDNSRSLLMFKWKWSKYIY